jgi:arylsulfatase
MDSANFELFYLATDPGEQKNLKLTERQKYDELMHEWLKFSEDVGVVTPTPEKGEGL